MPSGSLSKQVQILALLLLDYREIKNFEDNLKIPEIEQYVWSAVQQLFQYWTVCLFSGMWYNLGVFIELLC